MFSRDGLNSAAQAQAVYAKEECRIDPERMLQQAREHRIGLEQARKDLHSLAINRHINLGGDQFLIALGQVELDIIRAAETEAHWLAEMNKP